MSVYIEYNCEQNIINVKIEKASASKITDVEKRIVAGGDQAGHSVHFLLNK